MYESVWVVTTSSAAHRVDAITAQFVTIRQTAPGALTTDTFVVFTPLAAGGEVWVALSDIVSIEPE
jgi:hypothetical protein